MAVVTFPLPDAEPVESERVRLGRVLERMEWLVRTAHEQAALARLETDHWRAQAIEAQTDLKAALVNLERLIELSTANLLSRVDRLYPHQSLGPTQVRVLEAFEPERVYTTLELSEMLTMSRRALGDVLRSLAKRTLVVSVGYGQWRKVEG